MNTTEPHKKAEDILTDDVLSEVLNVDDLEENQSKNDDFKLARDIKNAAKSVKITFDPKSKSELDERIFASIKKAKRQKAIVRISSAAVFLLLVGLTTFFNFMSQSDIRKYATTETSLFDSNYTKLVLLKKEEIQIKSQESKISYSANGTEINIDDQTNSEQPLPADNEVYNTLIVPFGKRSQVILPDNTTVWLNSGSKLTYPVKFAQDKREVFLEGEAMFAVSHDENHPFYVLTNNVDVKVLGTNFNLSAYNDDQSVNTVLESGSVELHFKSKLLNLPAKEQMIPGMMAVYDKEEKSLSQTKVNTKDFTSWKDGYLIMEKHTLGSIVKKLSRYYNVTIEFENPELADESFSGYLDLRDSALKVLEVISEIVDAEVVQRDQIIRIKRKS